MAYHRFHYLMQQETPATTTPWWVSEQVIDEDKEQVMHRLVKGPFATREEAYVALVQRMEQAR